MKTILVVDDELGIANVVAATLEDEGYRVLSASNGLQGLEQLNEGKPDLIVSDFMMPFMDGATMIRQIRANAALQRVPILIVSAMQEALIRSRFEDLDAFLRKPFRIATLLNLVEELLSKADPKND